MHSFRDQFEVMFDALARGGISPGGAVNARFKKNRFNKARRALQCRNVLVPATGAYLNANSNSTFTVFTQPLGFDVIVFGCSLSSDIKPTTNALSIIRGEVRVRPPAPMSANNIQPQKAFAPATYSIFFPAPFVLNAGDQIATDFGFNAPQSADPNVDTAEQQILFFCLQVKECLDSTDKELLKAMQLEILGSDYQRKFYIPCTNFALDNTGALSQEVIQTDAIGFAEAKTRPLSRSVLVTGWSITNGGNVRLALGDSALQQSFTLGALIKAPNLFWAFSPTEDGVAGPFYSYFRLPVPHLLRQGAQLTASASSGLTGPPTGIETLSLMFECVTI
jgi:hypothetical protein